MTGWLSVILIVLVLLGVLILYLRKHNLLPTWLSNFLSPKSEELVVKLKSQTELELQKSQELQAVLEAKQNLLRAKARNTTLHRDISEINEGNVNMIAKKHHYGEVSK